VKANITERFHDSYIPVTECGCWLWTKTTYGRGYGCMFLTKTGGPRNMKAHRFSWELHNGPIPDGLHVLHKCDVRTCVNPDHLFLGTNQDNIDDRVKKGRSNNGQQNKTHCPQGHPYSGNNLRINVQGARTCKTCMNNHSKIYKAKKKLLSEN